MGDLLKRGTLLIVETGEYSDRSWGGPVRVLKDATREELADAFKGDWKPPKEWPDDKPDPSEFLPWLIRTGRAEHVDGVESWHVGSYGELEP